MTNSTTISWIAMIAAAREPEVWMLTLVVLPLLLFLSLIALLAKQYKRCPSNQLLVIHGKTGTNQPMRVMHGGAAFIVPLVQSYGFLSLEPIRITVSPSPRPSKRELEMKLPSSFTVVIGTHPELMRNAASRLLGLSTKDIAEHAKVIIVNELTHVLDTADSEIPPTCVPFCGE